MGTRLAHPGSDFRAVRYLNRLRSSGGRARYHSDAVASSIAAKSPSIKSSADQSQNAHWQHLRIPFGFARRPRRALSKWRPNPQGSFRLNKRNVQRFPESIELKLRALAENTLDAIHVFILTHVVEVLSYERCFDGLSGWRSQTQERDREFLNIRIPYADTLPRPRFGIEQE
jgi:hypothetical protein